MAQEEVVKVVRVRGKVSMKGTYWKNQKEDSTGENDFKLKVTKKGRKDYLIIFQRVGGNGYSVSNSIGGSYEVKIGENEEIKSVDELINIFSIDNDVTTALLHYIDPLNPHTDKWEHPIQVSKIQKKSPGRKRKSEEEKKKTKLDGQTRRRNEEKEKKLAKKLEAGLG